MQHSLALKAENNMYEMYLQENRKQVQKGEREKRDRIEDVRVVQVHYIYNLLEHLSTYFVMIDFDNRLKLVVLHQNSQRHFVRKYECSKNCYTTNVVQYHMDNSNQANLTCHFEEKTMPDQREDKSLFLQCDCTIGWDLSTSLSFSLSTAYISSALSINTATLKFSLLKNSAALFQPGAAGSRRMYADYCAMLPGEIRNDNLINLSRKSTQAFSVFQQLFF